MQGPTLADGLAQAGTAVKLLWKPNSPAEKVPVVKPEFEGWRIEQKSWQDAVALLDLSHHMADLYVEGPDATKLLSYTCANNFENFAVGQAKQMIAVSSDGNLIQDAILVRLEENKYNVIGIGTTHAWVAYHAKEGGYDVKLTLDPPSSYREGNPPVFRFQVQGPNAGALLAELFGDQLEGIKFFHFREVSLDGHKINALRHGMAGQAGFEFFGPWESGEFVKNAILRAGEKFGIKQIGGLAYYTVGVDSGWFATPVPAIYTQPELEGFRKFTSLFSYEGQSPLHGSFFSPNIEDYYRTPYELGYGRSISFNHDFVGREALQALRDKPRREKVTLIWNADDVKRVFGADHGYILSYTKDRVEAGSKLVGVSEYATYVDSFGTVHSLAIVDKDFATVGTELTLKWGQHPGPDAQDDPSNYQDIRVTVESAPLNEVARTSYRAD